ncbi:MAG: hypothetical protein AAGC67_08320 [Myxococcota bacterium]
MKMSRNFVVAAAVFGASLASTSALAGSGPPVTNAGDIVLGYSDGGDGFFEAREGESPFGTDFFARSGIGTYNTSGVGSTAPVYCNLDDDADFEVVLGYGSVGQTPGVLGGFVEIRDIKANNHASTGTFLRMNVPGTTWQADNGATRPACGDIDNDGRDELVIGLGSGANGFVRVLDDAVAGFAPLGPIPGGYLRFQQPGSYNTTNGETFVAVGNLDGDAAEEIAISGGVGAGGVVQLYDDAGASFATLSGTPIANGFVRILITGGYGNTIGAIFPAICDLDGTGNGELVLGGTVGAGGFVEIKDASASFAGATGTPFPNGFTRLRLTAGYSTSNGTAIPFCGDLDDDGIDELGLGTGDADTGIDGGLGFIQLKGDLLNDGLDDSDLIRANSGPYRATGNGATGSIAPFVAPAF